MTRATSANLRVCVSIASNACLQVWELCSGVLLCTFSFNSEVMAVVMDSADYRVFAATSAGRIYQINCFDQVCQCQCSGKTCLQHGLLSVQCSV